MLSNLLFEDTRVELATGGHPPSAAKNVINKLEIRILNSVFAINISQIDINVRALLGNSLKKKV